MVARYAGFKRLAAYIFGQNIAMTAPVAQAQSIAMTAPVAQESAEGGWTVSFYMPAKYTLATLPKPVDPGVVIHEVPGLTYAVYRAPIGPWKARWWIGSTTPPGQSPGPAATRSPCRWRISDQLVMPG
jgi:hypothetical protein